MGVEAKSKIIEAARSEFITFGFHGARMQSIANKAGVNKALLHYYFKDKETLYREVFEFAVIQIKAGLSILNHEDKTIQQKIDSFGQFCFHLYKNNPDIMIFIASEIHKTKEIIPEFVLKGYEVKNFDICKQIEDGIKLGFVQSTEPEEVVMMILGLTLYPTIAFEFHEKFLQMPNEKMLILLEKYYQKISSKIMALIRL